MTRNTFNPDLPDDAEVLVDLYAIEPFQAFYGSEKSQGSNQPSVRRCWEKRMIQISELCKIATLKYPSCIFSIRQKNSNSRLLVSHDLYAALLDSNKGFDKFGDFALSFGWKLREHDVGPPPCHFNVGNSWGHIKYFECAYGLRYVELNGHGHQKEPWSVRQTAVYHNFKGDNEIWIFISPSLLVESKAMGHVDEFKEKDVAMFNPFELHLKLVTAALSNYRWYIKSLMERAAEQSIRVVSAQVGQGKLSSLIDFQINFEDRQLLKVVEDLALDLLTIFDSTADTIKTIM